MLGVVVLAFLALQPLASAVKPDHCRPDLPGCCPKEIRHVFFLHVEKTGGTYARNAIRRAMWHAFPEVGGEGMAPACNYIRYTAYDCHPATDQPQNAACNWRNRQYYLSQVAGGAHFREGRCAVTSAHHDARFFDAFPPDIRRHTLLITLLREPAARTVSHFQMLRRFNITAATLAASVEQYAVWDPRGVARTKNKQARMVSGDFCCTNGTAIPYGSPAVLERAMQRMQDDFCVMGIMERMEETLSYLHFVLGVRHQPDGSGPGGVFGTGGARPLEPALAGTLRLANGLDVQLYDAAGVRFEAQMAAMRAAAGTGAGGA